jgi:cell filamentation protein
MSGTNSWLIFGEQTRVNSRECRSTEMGSNAFLQEIARFLGELDAIHPFREGNGRSQMAFIGLIGATFGHPLGFEKLNPTTFLPAMVASYFGNREPLIVELKNLLI